MRYMLHIVDDPTILLAFLDFLKNLNRYKIHNSDKIRSLSTD